MRASGGEVRASGGEVRASGGEGRASGGEVRRTSAQNRGAEPTIFRNGFHVPGTHLLLLPVVPPESREG